MNHHSTPVSSAIASATGPSAATLAPHRLGQSSGTHHLSPIMELSHEASTMGSSRADASSLKSSAVAVCSFTAVPEDTEDIEQMRSQLSLVPGFRAARGTCPAFANHIELPVAILVNADSSLSPAPQSASTASVTIIAVGQEEGREKEARASIGNTGLVVAIKRYESQTEASVHYTTGLEIFNRMGSLSRQQRLCIERPLSLMSYDVRYCEGEGGSEVYLCNLLTKRVIYEA